MKGFLNGVIAAMLLIFVVLLAGNVVLSWQYSELEAQMKKDLLARGYALESVAAR